MTVGVIHICSLNSGVEIKRKTSYEDFRTQILAVGRFSSFEATEKPAFYTRLSRDPEVVVDASALEFPWVRVTRRIE